MAGLNGDNQENYLEEAVQKFIHERSQGQEPDIDEFVKQYPNLEQQLRQRIRNLQRIDTLFDTLFQADKSDFEDTVIRDNLVGQKLRNFEIVKIIGRGGMGVVYQARDSKLDRFVAIKGMPVELQANSTARTRFACEAKLLASLSHSNIGVIYDIIEQMEGSAYLVLEYVPGETLAERIARGSLKLEEALKIALQITEAVAAAHEHDVIHRDLKPGNIKITPEGKVKVLDFGLAKAVSAEAMDQQSNVTEPGRIIGTPAYMSPEQARGNPVDHRTDIWSFGCLMYEMLTGHHPFESDTATDTLVRIIEHKPDWDMLPQDTPSNIRVLLRRCLEKDTSQRLQHIGDAGIEIRETLNLPAIEPPVTTISLEISRPRGPRQLIGWTAAFLIVVAVVVSLVIRSLTQPGQPPRQPVTRFIIRPATSIGEEGLWHGALAISPDGKQLAYVDEGEGGGRLLYLRDMDGIEGRPLPGTEGAVSPFFSPDGEWLGFYDFAKRELKKTPVTGGTPTSLCKPENFMGGSWGPDNTIIFAIQDDALWRYTASGGMERLTTPDLDQGQGGRGHISPQVLPGGEAVLFTNRRGDGSRMEVLLLQTGQRHILLEDGTAVQYVPTGHLVFAREETLYAIPFDMDELKVTGTALPVVEGIHVSFLGFGQFTFSGNGTLAYIPAPSHKRSLVWVDRRGAVEPVGAPARAYQSVRVSPDGNCYAVTIGDKTKESDIWILDKARLTPHQLTFSSVLSDGRHNYGGIWTQDGKRVIFTFVPKEYTLSVPMWRLADRSGEVEPLAEAKRLIERCGLWLWVSRSLSPDGKYLLGGQDNIGVLPMDGEGDPWPFVRMDGLQRHPAFSPDGRWVAYDSDETGPVEVYVRPFPGPGGITQISTQGGYEPLWSRDGKELFYRCGDKMMVVAIEVVTTKTGLGLKAGRPQELFKGRFLGTATGYGLKYDLESDGRFIMIQEDEESRRTGINVVLNWFEELKRLAPPGKD